MRPPKTNKYLKSKECLSELKETLELNRQELEYLENLMLNSKNSDIVSQILYKIRIAISIMDIENDLLNLKYLTNTMKASSIEITKKYYGGSDEQ